MPDSEDYVYIVDAEQATNLEDLAHAIANAFAYGTAPQGFQERRKFFKQALKLAQKLPLEY